MFTLRAIQQWGKPMRLPEHVAQKLADYKEYHLNKGNQLTHMFGIPFVLLGGFALFAQIHLGSVSGIPVTSAVPVLCLFVFLYFRMAAAALKLMLLPLIGLAIGGHFFGLWPALAVFVAGWVFQFWGHAL